MIPKSQGDATSLWIASTVSAEPTGSHHLFSGVKLHGIFAVGVEVPIEGLLPPAEGIIGAGNGNPHIDAQHPRLNFFSKLAGRPAAFRIENRRVSITGTVNDPDRFLQIRYPDHAENRSEQLLLGHRHLRLYPLQTDRTRTIPPRQFV